MSFGNKVNQPDATTLLSLWLEEEIESLRGQRTEVEARIQRAERRLTMLRDQTTPVQATATQGAPALSQAMRSAEESVSPRELPPPQEAPTVPKRSIVSLGLETRTQNAINKAGIASFAQLISMTPATLRALPGFGAGCLTDLEAALDRAGFALARSVGNGRRARGSASNDAPTHRSAELRMGRTEGIASEASSETDKPESSRTNTLAPQYPAAFEGAVQLAYRFGVVRVDDIERLLGAGDGAAERALKSDPHWQSAPGGWFIRTTFAQSWLAKRTIEVLNGVKSVAIEPLFQALKRVATPKFLEHGCRMPTRALLITLVQELRTEGVRFDMVGEIVSADTMIHDRELSGTAQAILKAFDTHHRALTGAELTGKIQSGGLSEASAQVALSTSPLVHRLERGVYGLVGRHADVRDISNARLRREVVKMAGGVEGVG